MAGTIWSKWFWSDWDTDPALKLCSYAAQGLWMRLLCIAAAHDPIGYVAVEGRPLDSTDLSRMTGGTEPEVESLLAELLKNGVYSLDRKGRIYSRRMIRDAKKAEIARKNGKKGGNPNIRKQKENSGLVKGEVNGGDKPQKPEARSQKPDKEEGLSQAAALQTREPHDWKIDELADHLCRVAGVRNVDPPRINEHIDLVRSWIAAAADPPMLENLIKTGRERSHKPIKTLNYFNDKVHEAIARRDFPNERPKPSPGSGASLLARLEADDAAAGRDSGFQSGTAGVPDALRSIGHVRRPAP